MVFYLGVHFLTMSESKVSAAEQCDSPIKGAERAESVTLYGFIDSENESSGPSYDEIAARAYYCWLERGCPEGSPQVDWELAEEELRAERQGLGQTVRAARA